MAVQKQRTISHGGSQLVALIRDANEKYCGPISSFLGLKCDGDNSMELAFEDIDGALTSTIVTLTVAAGSGHGIPFKRVCQAIANTMQPNRQGAFVKIADKVTGEFCHSSLLSIDSVA